MIPFLFPTIATQINSQISWLTFVHMWIDSSFFYCPLKFIPLIMDVKIVIISYDTLLRLCHSFTNVIFCDC